MPRRPKPQRALVLTVGTGNVDQLEETLLAPLRKSIRQGEWARVVLVPSQMTRGFADRLREGLGDLPIEIDPLPKRGMEDDADACFAHMDGVLARLAEAGFPSDRVVPDFTRGTKAMSAALATAAVARGVPRLRYLYGGARDGRGMVVPGTEVVGDFDVREIAARRRLDLARALLLRGAFAAAEQAAPEPGETESLAETARFARAAAAFYGAWDRLDYDAAASAKVEAPRGLDPLWRSLGPTREQREWCRALAGKVERDPRAAAARLRRLAADLLANAERALRARRYEDAVIRAYRVLEMIGQARLASRGLLSSHLPADHPAVRAVRSQGRGEWGENRDRTLSAGRLRVTELLTQLGDPMGAELRAEAERPLGPRNKAYRARNDNILVHGFEALGARDARGLEGFLGRLEALLLEDEAEAVRRLRTARSLDLSGRDDALDVEGRFLL